MSEADFTISRHGEADPRLAFSRKLQALSTRIHAAGSLDEIMLDLGMEFCGLFNCERYTLYAMDHEKDYIVSKFKTGLTTVRDLKLAVTPHSIPGYVALTHKIVNIADVYDDDELQRLSPELRFQHGVDQRTGYRTREMLVAPLVAVQSRELLGVVQFINHRAGGPFSQIAVDGVQELCETLSVALSQRMKASQHVRTRYDGLIADAVLAASDLEDATRSAREQGIEIEEVLLGELQVKAAAIGRSLSKFYAVPYEPFRLVRVKPEALLANLTRQYVDECRWLPLEENSDGLVVLTIDPERIANTRIVSQVFPRAKLDYRVTTQLEFDQTVVQFYGTGGERASVGEPLRAIEGPDDEGDGLAEEPAADDSEMARLVNKIIVDAHRQGATDIHIEPLPGMGKTGIRFRKGGALVPYIEIPGGYRRALVERVKSLGGLDVAEQRQPQDGKISFKKYGALDIQLRVTTIPSSGNVEDVVLRILAARETMPLDLLGMQSFNLDRLRATVEKPYGLFLVCGPADSGKSTTLHAMLKHLNTPATKIWSVEDPVEITQQGVRQVEVDREAGQDFATIMRALLRADADVIMVDAMGDRETADMGIDAALAGHLVCSTLHTHSAPESVARLLDMGVDQFKLADALLGVLAQRLARRLCPACKQAYHPTGMELELMLTEYCEELNNAGIFGQDAKAGRTAVLAGWRARYADKDGKFTLYRAAGCGLCEDGYRGRIGLHELLVVSDKVRLLLQERARVAQLRAAAVEDGMPTLRMDGIEKILLGHTDIKMVRAACIR
jgi:type II secretory ATPase GspE/PulE/Tfp pilus assembly ATPase PilB-like protein/GAF domain-containing protein